MRALVVFLLLIGALCARAVNSTYTASPNLMLRPPFPNSKLLLVSTNFTVDPDAGRFVLTIDTSYSSPFPRGAVGPLPRTTLIGSITWQLPGIVMFSFTGENSVSCQQATSSPPMCPYLESLVDGPFVFGATPSTGATLGVVFQALTTYIDPITQKPRDFLGSYVPFYYVCVGSCEPFGAAVPPAPLPQNASFTVRRELTDEEQKRESVECCTRLRNECIDECIADIAGLHVSD